VVKKRFRKVLLSIKRGNEKFIKLVQD